MDEQDKIVIRTVLEQALLESKSAVNDNPTSRLVYSWDCH